jgi:hypothetical protein
MITLTEEQWAELTTCPEWCATNHTESHPDGMLTFHDGPKFGGVHLARTVFDPNVAQEREWSVCINESHYNPNLTSNDYSANEARLLSADLMAAVAWLAARQ